MLFRRQDAGAVGAKSFGMRCVRRVLELAGHVVGGGGPFGKGSIVAAVDVRVVVGDAPFLAEPLECGHAAVEGALCVVLEGEVVVVGAFGEGGVVGVGEGVADSGVQKGLQWHRTFRRGGKGRGKQRWLPGRQREEDWDESPNFWFGC